MARVALIAVLLMSLAACKRDAQSMQEAPMPRESTPPTQPATVATEHAPIPPIAEMAYPVARKALIHSGWQPLQTKSAQDLAQEPPGPLTMWWEHGFTEVETCAASGVVPCAYLFKDAFGNELRVHAQGEDEQTVREFELVKG